MATTSSTENAGTSCADDRCPLSVVDHRAALAGLLAFLLVLLGLRQYPSFDPLAGLVLLALTAAGAVLAAERVIGCPQLLGLEPLREADGKRVALKCVGLLATYLLIGFAYWLLPVYREGMANVLWSVVRLAWLPVALLAPFYVWYVDRRMPEPRDGLYMAGLAVLGRAGETDPAVLRQYALAWLVKGFFLPIMAMFALADLKWFLALPLENFLSGDRGTWHPAMLKTLFLIDVFWAMLGYAFTLRLFNTEIRSVEPTLLGWGVCLLCYQPFWHLINSRYLKYEDGLTWGRWLEPSGAAGLVWGAAIIGLIAIYAWSTVSFGVRFSNLTHRGIITNGPYRWSKHPAYICKNIVWWMISVPFITNGPAQDAVRNCILLMLVNVVYYYRARTEEAHLSRDPAYVAYARWIERHGLIPRARRQLGKAFGRASRTLRRPGEG